jgi:hypothetical protein
VLLFAPLQMGDDRQPRLGQFVGGVAHDVLTAGKKVFGRRVAGACG